MPSTLSRMSGPVWAVQSRWHQRCHGYWTSITFETMVWGRGRELGWPRSLVPLSPIMPLTSGRPSGFSFIVRTAVYKYISGRGGPRSIKLERLLGQWVNLGTSWSSHFYSIIRYSLGNGPSAFLYCHWVGGEVGWLSYPHSCTCEEECSIPSLVCL